MTSACGTCGGGREVHVLDQEAAFRVEDTCSEPVPGIAAIPGEHQIQSKCRGGCRCGNWEGSVKAVAAGSVAEKAVVGIRPQDAVPGGRRQFGLLALEARMVGTVAENRLRGSPVSRDPHEHRRRK